MLIEGSEVQGGKGGIIGGAYNDLDGPLLKVAKLGGSETGRPCFGSIC